MDANKTVGNSLISNCQLDDDYLTAYGLRKYYSQVGHSINGYKMFDLYSKSIKGIDRVAFDEHKDIKELWLGRNKIKYIDPRVFKNLVYLKKLGLGGNQLTQIDEKLFENLVNLKCLVLGMNEISVIHPNAFRYLYNLETLYLNDNQLLASSFDEDIFAYCPNLKRIWLNGNKFKVADLNPIIFRGLSKLKELYINESNINSVEEFRSEINKSRWPHLLDLREENYEYRPKRKVWQMLPKSKINQIPKGRRSTIHGIPNNDLIITVNRSIELI